MTRPTWLLVAGLLLIMADVRAGCGDTGSGPFPMSPCVDDPLADREVLSEDELAEEGFAEEDFAGQGFAGRDRAGLRRDTWYFLGYQVVAIGALYVSPESFSGWSDDQKEDYNLSKWWDNVTHPVWDEDADFINYVLHPYWGATYYVRARERGYDGTQSFWYSALLSSMYEFGAEALFEPASIQDLIVTPVGGTMMGHYFMKLRDGIREREERLGYRRTSDKILSLATDPLGAINQQVDKMLGYDAAVEVHPFLSETALRSDASPGSNAVETERVYGLRFHVSW